MDSTAPISDASPLDGWERRADARFIRMAAMSPVFESSWRGDASSEVVLARELGRALDELGVVLTEVVGQGAFKIVFGVARQGDEEALQVCRVMRRESHLPLTETPSVLQPNRVYETPDFVIEIMDRAVPAKTPIELASFVTARLSRE